MIGPKNTLILSHRGNLTGKRGTKRSENTIAAFRNIINRKQIDGIEFDVDQTADGELIVHHDNPLKGRTVRFTLRQVREKYQKHDIPLFKEALKELVTSLNKCNRRGKVLFDIEIKKPLDESGRYHKDFEKKVLFAIRSSGLRRSEYIITSFNPFVIKKIGALSPRTTTGILLAYEYFNINKKSELERCEKIIKISGADCLVPNYKFFKQGSIFRKFFESTGKTMYVWTVNNRDIPKFLKDPLLQGIISDQPEQAARVRISLG
jgi:glycerophosphoryl diester phosphodiesterase